MDNHQCKCAGEISQITIVSRGFKKNYINTINQPEIKKSKISRMFEILTELNNEWISRRY
jgi:hypothetical protein